MGRCIDCVHFPWRPDADVAYLPAHRCHPALPARRWNATTVTEQNACPFFSARVDDTEEFVGEAAPSEPEPEVAVERVDGAAPSEATAEPAPDEHARVGESAKNATTSRTSGEKRAGRERRR